MQTEQLAELLVQSLEHEKGGVQVYETALKCAVLPELAQEWQKYLDQTRMHVRVLEEVLAVLKVDPYLETAGRQVVRHNGAALVQAMEMALAAGRPEAAQLVACECIVLAETKDHADWELLGKVSQLLIGEAGDVVRNAYEQVEVEEDEHLYHSKGWYRELWLKSLGLNAQLPPPEETQDVRTAMEAAEVAEQRA
jgi:hypothetical protein